MPRIRFFSAFLLMIAILLCASGVYLAHINQVSFWEDESWMAIALKGDLVHVWTFATERGLHPPLYFILGWFYTRFTGDSEIALRWLAGLCGLIGIAGTYRLSADWFGRRAGVYAALLAAGSLFIIYFARLGRHYTLFFALATLLAWVYSRKFQIPSSKFQEKNKEDIKFSTVNLLLIALLQSAVLYTHYFGVWMALVIGLHGLLTLPRRAALHLIGALAAGSGLFVFWLPSLVTQVSGTERGLGYASTDVVLNLRAYLDRVLNGDYTLGFVLVLLGIVALWRWRKRSIGLFLAIWLTIPLLLSLWFNTRFPWFIERNMIFTLGGAYALLGAGLAWVSQYRYGKVAAPIAAMIFVALGVARYDLFWPFITPDWRDMAHAVAQDARPDDTFVLNGEPYSMTYYLDREMNADVNMTPLKTWLDNADQLERIWLMDANWAVQDKARQALPADMVMTRQYALGVLAVEFYQQPPHNELTTFGGQIRLGYEVPNDFQAHPGENLRLDLWWQALRSPEADYSVGVYLVDANGLVVAQQDGGFDSGRVSALALPRDHWTPDTRTLSIPVGLATGDYTLTVAVYDWQTNERLSPQNGWENGSFPLEVVRVVER